jgi:hypothetical protein
MHGLRQGDLLTALTERAHRCLIPDRRVQLVHLVPINPLRVDLERLPAVLRLLLIARGRSVLGRRKGIKWLFQTFHLFEEAAVVMRLGAERRRAYRVLHLNLVLRLGKWHRIY